MSLGTDGTESYNKDQIYFASRDAISTAGILLEKGRSFYNLLQANFYLEKLASMWKALTR